MQVELTYKNEKATLSFDLDLVVVGKGDGCDIQLKGWFIANKHFAIKKLMGGYVIEDLNRGANGTEVNGKRIDLFGPLNLEKDIVTVANYSFRVIDDAVKTTMTRKAVLVNDVAEPLKTQNFDEKERKSEPVERAAPIAKEDIVVPSAAVSLFNEKGLASEKLELEWMRILRVELLKHMDLRRKDVANMTQEELRNETTATLNQILLKIGHEIPTRLNIDRLTKKVLDEAIGLGPLEELLADVAVTEIMVNARNEIFIEQSGKIIRSALEFTNDRAVLDVIERIVSPLGRRIDESSPMVDARLADGSRVNAIIPPLALKGPTITIRKFPSKRVTVEDLVGYDSMSEEMAEFLKICVVHKKNVIISGGTGSGKTTLLNVLSSFIPRGERVITIEDAAELRLDHDHLISLEARPGNNEGKGIVMIRDLVKNSLRMRPDRIVIGECRGAETLDMLQAMNTGHEGSLTTLHSNSPRDAVARMETMVMMAGMDLPLTAIRDQITSAIDIIVQQTRFSCGSRKVTYITELTGMESGKIQLQDIFLFNRKGYNPQTSKVMGSFDACGVVPSFYDELRSAGVELDLSMFSNGE